MDLYTIGHSNREFDVLVEMLSEHEVKLLVDVRRFPGSRRQPQFHRDALAAGLADAGIDYRWMEALGGRRSGFPEATSPNHGLRVASFRQYADYMQTPAFREAAELLVDEARQRRTAIMCAEATYWRCHRRLISDYLTALGHRVLHIMGPGQLRPHKPTDVAQFQATGVIYPPLLFRESHEPQDDAAR